MDGTGAQKLPVYTSPAPSPLQLRCHTERACCGAKQCSALGSHQHTQLYLVTNNFISINVSDSAPPHLTVDPGTTIFLVSMEGEDRKHGDKEPNKFISLAWHFCRSHSGKGLLSENVQLSFFNSGYFLCQLPPWLIKVNNEISLSWPSLSIGVWPF